MINVVTDLKESQKSGVVFNLNKLDHLCVCEKCNALLQFEEKDINREKTLPHLGCPCGNSIQLHSKYIKE
jgi:hypothetical protein